MKEQTDSSNPRKDSDATESIQSATSSPISSVKSSRSMTGERKVLGQRTMPRTSSIDSAISSLSSVSQSHKTSFDATALSQADIGNLIATAGSAEAVIVHLLKEKHHAASQNSQLWRLVEKQRTMVLGLNKDLERALKEKERYKKKVKELQTPTPPLPSVPGPQAQHKPPSNNDEAFRQTTAGEEPPSIQATHAGRSELGEVKRSGSDSEGLKNLHEIDPSLALRTGHTKAKPGGILDRSQGQNSPDPPTLVYARQELSRTSPTSLTSSNSAGNEHIEAQYRQQNVSPPARKPPPAPLNLNHLDHTNINHPGPYDSDSDYEDILAVDELPVDRGRRKTRDEDDRDRDFILSDETNPPSNSDNNGNSSLVFPGLVGSASEPRQRSTSSEQVKPSGFTLSPNMAHAPSFGDHHIITAPKSPGLPISPRPEDRPIGSPLPRMPRDMSNPLNSLPVSSDANVSGLALSARGGKYQDSFATGPSTPSAIANEPSSSFAFVDATSRPMPSIDSAVRVDSPQSLPSTSNGIYQGLVSPDYPDLLLPPNALPSTKVKVSSSRLRPSRNSYMASKPFEEEPVFTLSIFSRSNNSELWRIEKVIAALPLLDQQVKQVSSFSEKLPDRSIFTGHSPAKVDARRAALNSYFEALLNTCMDEKAALVVCQFLSSHAIEARDDETSLLKGNDQPESELIRGQDGKPRKEGYLTKRGKNFGGWKARYFVLHGPELKYYESPGGAHMGTIKIYNAQIGKQSQNGQNTPPSGVEDDTDNQYRHAFLILEPKKKDSSALVRHVLCAESDEERDTWVEALLEHVGGNPEAEASKPAPPKAQVQAQASSKATSNTPGKPKLFGNGPKKGNRAPENSELEGADTVQGFSFDSAVPAEPPVFGPSIDQPNPKPSLITPGPSTDNSEFGQLTSPISEQGQSSKFISGPTNGAVIQNAGAWGNKATTTSTKEKKRSIWGFRTRSSFDLASQVQTSSESPTTPVQSSSPGFPRELVRPVFGIPLAEAVQFCAPQAVDVTLPAVVYRCIEYLTAKKAELEEGIFRLSGSNVVIKGLKERFNTEGDIDFLADDQYYDVHAIASLFKQYLRELPATVLTRELHLEFLRVLDLQEKHKRIQAFNFLVYKLPRPNYTLLRALVQFLIVIVNNSDVNKMTIRNVGIVFAPTLNIPAPVFSMFLTDFEDIFEHPPTSNLGTLEPNTYNPNSPDDIRSPRRQMFSDIPTPAYNQTTFRRNVDPRDGANDTGFVSVQPSYGQHPNSVPEKQNSSRSGSPATNSMLSPSMDNSHSAKAKRRESSFLFMELNNQQSDNFS
ncbi:RhoGAP-domain-containing protein [Aspergillus campestris IBT 28561]|uniref:RhoGAP-domain-containing protein n=1 Tax=Aspergillus campestris (strain IBT 28561) TaxID=1392248 RepID=A0A2I1D293_ASPC2|nr:RhoGAP-domain-containing protein [Aspergillus campestris IBT 28561]PKY04003.1 RhoGAP-domain-containing protein [Aspergillus campestris IBT 28561]